MKNWRCFRGYLSQSSLEAVCLNKNTATTFLEKIIEWGCMIEIVRGVCYFFSLPCKTA